MREQVLMDGCMNGYFVVVQTSQRCFFFHFKWEIPIIIAKKITEYLSTPHGRDECVEGYGRNMSKIFIADYQRIKKINSH